MIPSGFFNMLKQGIELIDGGLAKTRQPPLSGLGHDGIDLLKQGRGRWSQIDAFGASVLVAGAAFDEALFRQLVKRANQRRGFDADGAGQVALWLPFLQPPEMVERDPACLRQTQRGQTPIKNRAPQAGEPGESKADVLVHGVHLAVGLHELSGPRACNATFRKRKVGLDEQAQVHQASEIKRPYEIWRSFNAAPQRQPLLWRYVG